MAGRRVAAPSWVIPGSILDNCRFLSGKVDEIGLCFFEAETCLAYSPEDLPPELSSFPFTYHVHLPLDLDWTTAEKAAFQALALMDKVEFLGVERAVLHPPQVHQEESLRTFIDVWELVGRKPEHILLENVRNCSLVSLERFIEEKSLHVCLDMGHVLKYKQEELLQRSSIMEKVALFHANAPDLRGDSGRHLPLTSLDRYGNALGVRICKSLPRKAVIMPELFSWPCIEASMPILAEWLCEH